MLLKPGNNDLYGIPYMGSKTKLIEKISKYFPNADNFYDLFGGGFSVTHYMLMHRSKSYKNFHFNELRPNLCQFIQDCIQGKYSYDNFKPKFISREEFEQNKDICFYTKICWSFGNNGKNYLFGKDIENYKRSLHNAVIFDSFDETAIEALGIDKWPNKLTIKGKRILVRKLVLARKGELQQLQQLERLERLEQTNRLTFYNQDYKSIPIKNNSVVYCDIPYKGTADYGNTFNHNEFYDWASSQTEPVFISEYNIEDNRLTLLKRFKHMSSFSSVNTNQIIEKLFCNKAALKHFPTLKVSNG